MLRLPEEIVEQSTDEFFREGHEVLVAGVGLIELDHREFRVVARGQAFVPEVLVEFVYLGKPPHEQALQVQLRGDAQVERLLQCVVEGLEGSGRSPSGDRVHHRRFDLEETSLIEEGPNPTDDLGSHAKRGPHRGVYDQVLVALPVSQLDIPKTVELLGQGPEGLCKNLVSFHLEGQFPGPGKEQTPLRPNQIPDIRPSLELIVRVFADHVLSQVQLQSPRFILHVNEAALSEIPHGHHAARQGETLLHPFEVIRGSLSKSFQDSPGRCGRSKLVWVGSFSLGTHLLHLLQTDVPDGILGTHSEGSFLSAKRGLGQMILDSLNLSPLSRKAPA